MNLFKKGTTNYKFYSPEGYTPIMGDLIFFKNNSTTTRISDHVGLVLGVTDEHVFTIEGNTSGGVFTGVYELDAEKIVGYAVPNYESEIKTAELIDDSVLMVSARETLNLRSQGNTSSTILGTLSYGTVVEVIGYKDGWANVKVDGKTGWVSMTYMLPEQFKRIKVTYNDGNGTKNFFVGADTLFGLPLPEADEGYEFCGYAAEDLLYTDVVDGRIVLSSKKNITLKAKFEKKPETADPETAVPSPDVDVNTPADTLEQWLEKLPPEATEGCASLVSDGASVIALTLIGALFIRKKKYK